ncbi:MAG: nucleoside-diphosphate kinase [Acidaminococcaceae bacterium]|jgi:nucleoside-diphosphate kinase|nr:nucleoside-diphosphate kinase [Acidaminococcaceae bacterium]
MEQTLVLVKPDGVRKQLIGEIVARFEKRGLKIAALKLVKMTEAQAKFHYAEHEGKPFFGELVEFITSGPVAAMVISGDNAIKAVRGMMGATNPLDSVPGSIRGDYALTIGENIVHGSDSPESAQREIANFFKPEEIY